MPKKDHLPRHYYPGYVFIPKCGYFQARKIGLKKETVQRDPRFHKTRLHAKEFGQIATWAKLIRTASCIGTGIKDSPHRLIGALARILQEDTASLPGARHILYGGIHQLEDFNFNKEALLEESCSVDWNIEYLGSIYKVQLSIPSFVPKQYIFPPQGITHCRIYMATVQIDMAGMTGMRTETRTTLIPIRNMHIPATELCSAPKAEGMTIYLVEVGIHWYTKVEAANKIMPSPIAGPLQIILAA